VPAKVGFARHLPVQAGAKGLRLLQVVPYLAFMPLTALLCLQQWQQQQKPAYVSITRWEWNA
jgi:hypothetical protein